MCVGGRRTLSGIIGGLSPASFFIIFSYCLSGHKSAYWSGRGHCMECFMIDKKKRKKKDFNNIYYMSISFEPPLALGYDYK